MTSNSSSIEMEVLNATKAKTTNHIRFADEVGAAAHHHHAHRQQRQYSPPPRPDLRHRATDTTFDDFVPAHKMPSLESLEKAEADKQASRRTARAKASAKSFVKGVVEKSKSKLHEKIKQSSLTRSKTVRRTPSHKPTWAVPRARTG
jgi:hypothetical protein